MTMSGSHFHLQYKKKTHFKLPKGPTSIKSTIVDPRRFNTDLNNYIFIFLPQNLKQDILSPVLIKQPNDQKSG